MLFRSDMDWNFAPEHVYDCLRMLGYYKKPLFVSEAGVADEKDVMRAEYIEKQVTGARVPKGQPRESR